MRHAIAFIPTDLMWALVEVAQPAWRPPMAKGADRILRAADMFAPYLERAVWFLHASDQSFGIEGEVIVPETAAQFRSDYEASVVFLVRRAAAPADVRDARGPNPWLQDAAPDLAASVAAEVAAWSARVEQACARLQLPCFDVGEDFERSMGDAAKVLTS